MNDQCCRAQFEAAVKVFALVSVQLDHKGIPWLETIAYHSADITLMMKQLFYSEWRCWSIRCKWKLIRWEAAQRSDCVVIPACSGAPCIVGSLLFVQMSVFKDWTREQNGFFILIDTDTWWRSEEEQMLSYWTALDWDFCGGVRIGLDSQRIWSIYRIATCFTGSTTSDRKPSLRSKLLMAHKRPLFQGKSEENDGQYRITNYTCIWWSTLYFQLHLWLAFVWRGRREEESLCFEMTLSLCFALPALQVACLAAWHKFAK